MTIHFNTNYDTNPQREIPLKWSSTCFEVAKKVLDLFFGSPIFFDLEEKGISTQIQEFSLLPFDLVKEFDNGVGIQYIFEIDFILKGRGHDPIGIEWTPDEIKALKEEMKHGKPVEAKLMNEKHGLNYNPTKQQKFLYHSAMVRIAVTHLLKNKKCSPEQLLRFIGLCREQIAKKCQHFGLFYYGRWRLDVKDEVSTPILGCYQHYHDFYFREYTKEIGSIERASFVPIINLVTGEINYSDAVYLQDLLDQEVPLTSSRIIEDNSDPRNEWVHPSPKCLEKLLPFIYKKMDELSHLSPSFPQWREKIIFLHYLLANTIVNSRGSSWGAEIAIEGYLAKYDLKLGSKDPGHSYDCDAFLYSYERYRETYPEFVPLKKD